MKQRMKQFASLVLLAGVIVGASPVAGASFPYQVQPIVRIGDRLGDQVIPSTGIDCNGLSDSGRLAFDIGNTLLLEYEAGQVVPVAVAGGEGPAPGGLWPLQNAHIYGWGNVNERGDFVFLAGTLGSLYDYSLYQWDAEARQVRPVSLDGLPTEQRLSDFPFTHAFINNNGDMALPIESKNAAGQRQAAVYFRSPDGKMQPVALPDQMLPDGHQVLSALPSSINDTGAVVFGVRSKDRKGQDGVYLWEGGGSSPRSWASTPRCPA